MTRMSKSDTRLSKRAMQTLSLWGPQWTHRRLELSISKQTPHGRLGQGPGRPFPVPEMLEFVAFGNSGKFFQQFSWDFPAIFLQNSRTDPGNSHSLLEFSDILRGYLSNTHLLHAMDFFWWLNMANWMRYPLPLFWAFSPWRACEVEVRYPPPQKEGYLSDTCAIPARYRMKTRQKGCDTPSAILSPKSHAIWGRISHWTAKLRTCLRPLIDSA